MKYIKYIILIAIISFTLIPSKIMASNKITVYLFHGSTCPHCQDGIEYLESLKDKYPDISIITYEVWDNTSNAELLEKVKKNLQSDSRGVPFFVIGSRYLTGFASYRKADITAAIDYYMENYNEYKDIVNDTINNKDNNQTTDKDVTYDSVDISDNSNKRMYKETFYLGLTIFILVSIYVSIVIYEKKRK